MKNNLFLVASLKAFTFLIALFFLLSVGSQVQANSIESQKESMTNRVRARAEYIGCGHEVINNKIYIYTIWHVTYYNENGDVIGRSRTEVWGTKSPLHLRGVRWSEVPPAEPFIEVLESTLLLQTDSEDISTIEVW